MPDEMIERVAKALRGVVGHWQDIGEVAQEMYRRDARAAIDAMHVWQPIETFPQDGKAYLVCDDRSLDGCHQVVFWDDSEDESEWRLATTDGPTFHKLAFTHWMPLPQPPKDAANGR